ncbi:hypothetical protein QQP08_014173 [Theobroma cacao]|nr:hypothetical protein QQP08_014173 [Theobroma cacao]
MARGEARFTCRVKLDHDFTFIPHLSQAGYHLQIRKLCVWLDSTPPPCSSTFMEVGWRPRSLERILDDAFSEAKLILQGEKNKCDFRNIPTIRFCFNKFVRWEDELEGVALELSMQEAPKPLPATKKSIQALKKVKVEGDIA